MPPINFETLAGIRFHTNERTWDRGHRSMLAHILLQNGSAAGKAERFQPLPNHGSAGLRILLE
jgi:hypothetical protein